MLGVAVVMLRFATVAEKQLETEKREGNKGE
jgi:hypothetical protein